MLAIGAIAFASVAQPLPEVGAGELLGRSAGQGVEVRESGERGLLPEEMRRAYGIDRLHESGLRGQGQTVAIMSFDTFLESDLEAWDREVGIVDGGPVEKRLVADEVPLGPGLGRGQPRHPDDPGDRAGGDDRRLRGAASACRTPRSSTPSSRTAAPTSRA